MGRYGCRVERQGLKILKWVNRILFCIFEPKFALQALV